MSFRFIAVMALALSGGSAGYAADAPRPAKSVGYTANTFSSKLETNSIDFNLKPDPKADWYPWRFFGGKVDGTKVIAFGKDGVASITGAANGHNAQLATGALDTSSGNFVGKSFGGGAYFEATIAFDAGAVISGGQQNGWPSFWSLAYEVLTRKGLSQWPGQPTGYEQYIELDILEYNMAFNGFKSSYGTDLHHFYGIRNVTCKNWFCDYGKSRRLVVADVPSNTNFSDFHDYGALWVPEAEGKPGFVQHYFDGSPIGTKTEWRTDGAETQPPPNGKPWAYSLLDKQHLVLVLGAGPEPMRVKSVNVWQKNGSDNIVK